jgi:hypothetical protein
MESITRLDLFAREYALLASEQRRHTPYFASLDQPEPEKEGSL